MVKLQTKITKSKNSNISLTLCKQAAISSGVKVALGLSQNSTCSISCGFVSPQAVQ